MVPSREHFNLHKENEETSNRADYFVSIEGVYIPFEAKKDIRKGGGVLHQIRKYANITEFTKTEYDATTDKLITKLIPIAKPPKPPKPHGVVLLGDKNGIYLAYSRLLRQRRPGSMGHGSCQRPWPTAFQGLEVQDAGTWDILPE